MNKEQLVPPVELCKQLKEAGFPQEGCAFYWVAYKKYSNVDGLHLGFGGPVLCLEKDIEKIEVGYQFAAPTVAEIGERLPGNMAYPVVIQDTNLGARRVSIGMQDLIHGIPFGSWKTLSVADTEADARAKLYCHLSRNGLMKEPPHA